MPKPLKFGLRTFLLVIAFLCLWVGYYAKWANDRREIERMNDIIFFNYYKNTKGNELMHPTPRFWAVMGFNYHDEIMLKRNIYKPDDLRRVQNLFPESRVSFDTLSDIPGFLGP